MLGRTGVLDDGSTQIDRAFAVEALQRRILYDASATLTGDGTLTILGTEHPEQIRLEWIQIRDESPEVAVRNYHVLLGQFSPGAIRRIVVALGAEHDAFTTVPLKVPFTIDGGSGNDTIQTSHGPDRISAGDGNDVVLGGFGNDTISGGDGSDTLSGGAQPDRIFGDLGNDRLNGNGGHDRLLGGAGADRLYGYEGNDWLDGGSSGDRLDGGLGADTMFGQSGDDRFLAIADSDVDALYGGSGKDWAQVDMDDTTTAIETAILLRD